MNYKNEKKISIYKFEKLNIIKDNIQKRFTEFCDNYKTELGEPFCSYSCCESIIDNLKKDYKNFTVAKNYELKFVYPYIIFAGEKNLRHNNYEKLKNKYSQEEQIYYVIYDKLKTIFNNLSSNVGISQIKTKLTVKELYNYNYFIDTQPRCCFCGQLLEFDKKITGEEYIIADIEHLLPKSKFPQFVLHPNNWAPCCKECNESIKKAIFFDEKPFENFKSAIEDLGLNLDNLHPLKLWKNLKFSYDMNNMTKVIINPNLGENGRKLLEFYHIEERANIIYHRCYNILWNIIRHSDIRSPESLEQLLENIASSNWHEVNDGYSLNNSPQIWQEFIENILYDECKLMALWDEVKSSELKFL